MTTIRYFVPEDGDSELHPNVFLAPKSSRPGGTPLLGQVKEAFPLPGTYHFRFKSPLFPGADRDNSSMAVWMDCVDDSQPVASWKNSIIAKVTRVGVDDDDEDDDDDDDFEGHFADTTAHSDPGATSAPVDPNFGLFDEPVAASVPSSTHSSMDNLFSATSPAPAASTEPELLNLNATTGSTQPSTPSSSHHNDFLNMSAPASTPAPAPAPAPAPVPMPAVATPPPVASPAPAPIMGSSMGRAPSQQSGGYRPTISGGKPNKNAFEAFTKKKEKAPFGSLRWG